MPSSSKKQSRTMTAACKSKKFRKKIGIPKDVACDFHKADKGKYHQEDIDMDELGRVKKLAGINEKVELSSDKDDDKKDIKAADVTKAMQMAKLKRKMENEDSDNVNFHGLLTGVARGEIHLDDKGKIAENKFGIIRALEEATKNHLEENHENDEEVTDDNIDMDRVVSDPEYREKVKAFLNREKTEDNAPVNEDWICGQCGNRNMGFLDTECSHCGASDEHFHHEREDEPEYYRDIEQQDVDENRSAEKKAGRRAAGSWGRPGSEYQKRQAGKKGRRLAKDEIEKSRKEVDEKAPKGWEGTVKKMKNKGYKHHAEGVEFDEYEGVDLKATKSQTLHALSELRTLAQQHERTDQEPPSYGFANEIAKGLYSIQTGLDACVKANPGHAQQAKKAINILASIREEAKKHERTDQEKPTRQFANQTANALQTAIEVVENMPVENAEDYMFETVESTMFPKDSLARFMVEMIVDEMKNGKTAEEISDELCFNLENVKFVVEHFKKKVSEGYRIEPAIDVNKHPERPGLEGPYRAAKSGMIYYYDPKQGQYYDASSDMYLSPEDLQAHGIEEQNLPGYDAWKTATPYDNEPSSSEVDRAFEDAEFYGEQYLQHDDTAKNYIADIMDENTDQDDKRGLIVDLISDVFGTMRTALESDGNNILHDDDYKKLAKELVFKHLLQNKK